MKTLVDFPELTETEIEHSEKLIGKIIEKMNGGVITFSDFMQMALYEPKLGYYTAGATKIGAAGDFVTAPEISILFGQCLANAIFKMFKKGRKKKILEYGAGTGKLCLDIINHLNSHNIDWQSYQILETSADLIERQKDFLNKNLEHDIYKKIEWINQHPNQFCGVILGNEVMDAMPVSVVIKQDEKWHELGVGFNQKQFTWQEVAGESVAAKLMKNIENDCGLTLPTGYCTEVNLQHRAWMKSLSESCLDVDVLLIDYGYLQLEYYHEDRTTGTLMCYFRHRAHSDPLILPGLQDITASVDFTSLAIAAEQCGFEVKDISTQAEFLINNDLLEFSQVLEKNNPNNEKNMQLKLAQQIKTLTLPSEMGETFKVMSFSKNTLAKTLN